MLAHIDELKALQRRLAAGQGAPPVTVIIPAGSCGQDSGANELIAAARRALEERQLGDRVALRITGCHGACALEPSVLVIPGETFYPRVKPEEMPRIVAATAAGEVVTELLYVDPGTGERIERQREVPFFARQRRLILGRHEHVDPLRIDTYLAAGGYGALAQILEAGRPAAVVEAIRCSRLRGRGAAGLPTGAKWEALAAQPTGRGGKYLVCNANEVDPGARGGRILLEGNPHGVIEGMLIGAFATGATAGIVCLPDDFTFALERLQIARDQARDLGLLGRDILGTGLSFDLQLVRGAGTFVCDGGTALVELIERGVAAPDQPPATPVQRGIFGRPTMVHHVETWATVPVMLALGADEFAQLGTRASSGTKLFTLGGRVRNPGLVEVPLGITIRELVFDIGGGPAGRGSLKAVQFAGPSGGWVPFWKFDLPIDHVSLADAGAMMGSGGVMVMDDGTCVVDAAKQALRFLKGESSGRCVTCREGAARMYAILDDISTGEATPGHLEVLEEQAHAIKDSSRCGLGQTAARPVLSTLRYFEREYRRHVHDRRCDAFACEVLVGAPCQAACPLGTEAWRYVAHIARGEYEEAYRVIREATPFPSVCARICDARCELRCRLTESGYPPIALRALERFVIDRVIPSVYRPRRRMRREPPERVAVVGAGPAGLTCAHYLSLDGYEVTLFEAEAEPGGGLMTDVPAYRLPPEVARREIASLLDQNIRLHCYSALGRDFTLDRLFADGHRAVFLAVGGHRPRHLGLSGEDAEGVHSAASFVRHCTVDGQALARGVVGVIGGGSTAFDAARVAVRQDGVERVTIFHRRSRPEMPVPASEIEAALEEGIRIEELCSPAAIEVEGGRLRAVRFVRHRPGPVDQSGRRTTTIVPGPGTVVPLDTLVVAIGARLRSFGPDAASGVEVGRYGALLADPDTLETGREGVFAGGDAVTGPGPVADAIAAGKQAAVMIGRYLRGEELRQTSPVVRPQATVEPTTMSAAEREGARRAEAPRSPADERRRSFQEVEAALTPEQALTEARRCLRCDLQVPGCRGEAGTAKACRLHPGSSARSTTP
jgi:NADH-quinone oxidoreductase subunit F